MISAIIVNHNCSYLTRLCIEALQKHASSVDGHDLEIIVVDNDSDAENLKFLQKLHDQQEIRLLKLQRNLGYGCGNNIGVQHAKGDTILILNPDIQVDAHTLQKMFRLLQENPDIGMVGPQLYYYNGVIQDSCRRFMSPLDLLIKRTPLKTIKFFKLRYHRYVMRDFDKSRTQDVDIVTGACFMMPRSVFEEVRGFDERYFLFMEDIDLCRKVWDAGYSVVYLPAARALHYHKRLSDGGIVALLFRRIFWIHIASALKYFWKWKTKPVPNFTKDSK